MKEQQESITEIRLILLNGKMIELEIPDKGFDNILQEMYECIESGEMWNCDNWGLNPTYMGQIITMINCKHVLGIA